MGRLCAKLQPLATEVRTQGGEFVILGVKQKFGTLRVVYRGGNDEIAKEVELAKADALRTCEMCGGPGDLRSERGYLTVLCVACHLEHGGDRNTANFV
jgi:hypothetical protein